MKSDHEIKTDVEAELRWTPDVDERHIAVAVNNGVVTLTGTVRRFLDKYNAERAVKRLAGVSGIANDIGVKLDGDEVRPDSEIAEKIVTALRLELPQAHAQIKPLVHHGSVTLEGKVEWQFQRDHAERIAQRQKGVVAVSNLIQVQPQVAPRDIERRIHAAFHRNAQIDANNITVDAANGTVTLRGRVSSWAERQEAQDTAWCAPGVTQVKNEINIGR
jgi:osmotically-inducible protein OsmY